MSNAALPFFLDPFCMSGTVLSVPVTGSNSGAMSYQYGFTPNYELDLQTNPDAIPIPRNQMNQLFLDITTACQQFQWYGTPNWIAPESGGPANYNLFSLVLHSNVVWESQVGSNTSIPGADNNWLSVSGGGQYIPIGTIIDFAGFALPANYFSCDGTAKSRTTYSQLFTVLTNVQNITELTSTTFTVTSAAGLGIGMFVEGAGIPTGTTISNISGTTITLDTVTTSTGTFSATFFAWGQGDGTSTFNVPDLSGQVTAGANGTLFPMNENSVGNDGGAETYTLVAANLPPHAHSLPATTAGGSTASGGSNTQWIPGAQNTGDGPGTSTAFSIVQPTSIVYKCIRYK